MHFKMSSAICFNLDQLKILLSGLGFRKLSLNPLPDDKFDSSKFTEFADDIFKFDENGRKLSKWAENTVGKGEIARYD